MFKLLSFLIFFVIVQGHSGKTNSDADTQSALIPQELNPAFASEKDYPWQAIIPTRYRRDIEPDTTLYKLKKYSRAVACVVLAISAVVEIVVYFIEMYST